MKRMIQIDPWREAGGGFRSSFLLQAAAVLILLGTALNASSHYLLTGDVDPAHYLVVVAWTSWIAGLWVIGLGFAWVATSPILSLFGMVPGLLHLAQGTFLLILLFTTSGTPFPPVILTIARLLSLAAFGLVERHWIGRSCAIWLTATAGLQAVKVLARLVGFDPIMNPTVEPAVDAIILALQAVAIFHLGTTIRRSEDIWAQGNVRDRTLDFADFNNPEHDWNKESKDS